MEETHYNPIIPDHTVPLQGEFDMKNNNDGGGEMNMNMKPEINAAELERDIEKRVIREEIIAAEIRRRELVDEVRMDLMREKQILGMGNFYGFSNVDHAMSTNYGLLGSQYRPNYDEYLGINPHPLGNYGIGSEEKCHIEDGIFGKSTFDRGPSSVTAHVAGKFNDEMVEEVMSEATASTGIIGMKRKAETPARSCDSETTPTSTGIIGMKRKVETPARSCDGETTPIMSNDSQKWFCSLCEVSATSEVTLNSHFQGKKHKSNEARSKANDTPAIIATSAASLQPVSIKKPEGDNSSVAKKWECLLCQVPATSEIHLFSHCQGKKHKAKEAKLQTGEIIAKIEGFPADKSVELSIVPSSNAISTTASNTQWYCSLCGVSASSENGLNDHFKGKKHKSKAGLSQQGNVIMNPESTVEITGVQVMIDMSLDEQKPNILNTQLSNDEESELGIVDINQESTEDISQVEFMKNTILDGGKSPKQEQKPSNQNTDFIRDAEIELEVIDDSSKKMEGIGNVVDENKEESGVEESQDMEELVKEGVASVEFVKYWHCKMCNKGTRDEATMDAHRKSDEHMTMLNKHGGALISVVSIPNDV